ncbi:MAG TPA: hypothetical protein VHY34_06720 [Caulobacteraceae bacterium]|jgi:uncharacterized membrane-anchored protein|nr:hypothetical protein [Caulobacteraceae bacterium]
MTDDASPKIEPKYWVALCWASICGLNLGDFFPDQLHLTTAQGLGILGIAFAALYGLQLITGRRPGLLFWGAILVVRAAATLVADFPIDDLHLSYVVVGGALALILLGGMAISGVFRRTARGDGVVAPGASLMFWLTMLAAGALGTVAADGFGHAFSSVKIGVPVAAACETLLLALAFPVRARANWAPWTYWATVVVISAWGASVGDIARFLLSLPVSMGLSAAVLALVVVARWPRGESRAQA